MTVPALPRPSRTPHVPSPPPPTTAAPTLRPLHCSRESRRSVPQNVPNTLRARGLRALERRRRLPPAVPDLRARERGARAPEAGSRGAGRALFARPATRARGRRETPSTLDGARAAFLPSTSLRAAVCDRRRANGRAFRRPAAARAGRLPRFSGKRATTRPLPPGPPQGGRHRRPDPRRSVAPPFRDRAPTPRRGAVFVAARPSLPPPPLPLRIGTTWQAAGALPRGPCGSRRTPDRQGRWTTTKRTIATSERRCGPQAPKRRVAASGGDGAATLAHGERTSARRGLRAPGPTPRPSRPFRVGVELSGCHGCGPAERRPAIRPARR